MSYKQKLANSLRRCSIIYRMPLIIDVREGNPVFTPIDIAHFKIQNSRRLVGFIVNIPISKIMHSNLLETWVQVLKAWSKEDTRLELYTRDSFKILKGYYDDYQPKSTAEIQGIDYDDHKLTSVQKEYFSSQACYSVQPWAQHSPEEALRKRIKTMRIESKKHYGFAYKGQDGFKSYGPISERLLLGEYNRLIELFKAFSKAGFRDEFGYPTAYTFIDENDYLIVPKHGWHRTAVMIALGYKDIPYVFRPKRIDVIDKNKATTWRHVVEGLFSEEQALDIFERRFVAQTFKV